MRFAEQIKDWDVSPREDLFLQNGGAFFKTLTGQEPFTLRLSASLCHVMNDVNDVNVVKLMTFTAKSGRFRLAPKFESSCVLKVEFLAIAKRVFGSSRVPFANKSSPLSEPFPTGFTRRNES